MSRTAPFDARLQEQGRAGCRHPARWERACVGGDTRPDAGTAGLVALGTRAAAAECAEGVSPFHRVAVGPGEPMVIDATPGVDRRWAPLSLSATVLLVLAYGAVLVARRRAGDVEFRGPRRGCTRSGEICRVVPARWVGGP